jgi:hypothetical protein
MDPKILEKNTLLHKVSQTAHPEIKKGSIRPEYYMRGLPVC